MKVAQNLSKEFTVGNLFRNTFAYILENWKNIMWLFGTVFLVAEGILWGVESFMGQPQVHSAYLSISMVLTLLLEVTCLPFVVWNKPVPSLGGLPSYAQEFRAPSRKALLWLFIRGISLGIMLMGGSLVLGMVLPFWLFILAGALWVLLTFWILIRTSFLGPILACGDASKGWSSVWASWRMLKGFTFKMGVTYGLVFLLGGLVSLILILGRANLFEVIDYGTMELGTRLLYLCTDVLIEMAMAVPTIVFVGVAYRLKRDEVLAFIQRD